MSRYFINAATGERQTIDENGNVVCDSYPETTKMVFDFVINMANDAMARITCEIHDAIEEDRKKNPRTKLIRTDDL